MKKKTKKCVRSQEVQVRAMDHPVSYTVISTSKPQSTPKEVAIWITLLRQSIYLRVFDSLFALVNPVQTSQILHQIITSEREYCIIHVCKTCLPKFSKRTNYDYSRLLHFWTFGFTLVWIINNQKAIEVSKS